MREIRTSGSEGGARLNPLSLPLSTRTQQTPSAGVGELFKMRPFGGIHCALIRRREFVP